MKKIAKSEKLQTLQRRLAVVRTTIRHLEGSELAGVQGGQTIPPKCGVYSMPA